MKGGSKVLSLLFATLSLDKGAGVDGGASAAAAWTQWPLTTELDPNGIVVLAGNVFTLLKGRYIFDFRGNMYNPDRANCRLVETGGGTMVLQGCGAYGIVTAGTSFLTINGIIDVVAASQSFQIEYYTNTGQAGNGLGVSDAANANRYAQAFITKVA